MAAEDQDAQNWERANPRESAWHDRETLSEFKRLMDADCLYLTVITGQDRSKDRDATHHLPRLLEIAERGLNRRPVSRDAIAQAIRGQPRHDEPAWEVLDEDRKEGWRQDADRVLAVLNDPAAPPPSEKD